MVARTEMLTAVEEAALVGKNKSTVSRARRDPSHPANGRNALTVEVGKHTFIQVPKSEILAWWPPDGLTRRQWVALRAIAEDRLDPARADSTWVIGQLAAAGVLAVDDASGTWKLTPKGKALVAAGV